MLTTKETPPPLDVLDAHERESLRALLEARSEPDRLQAAYQLRRVVARAARETSGETFGRFEDELYGALFRAVHHGRTLENRLGGVAALEALIGAPSAEPEGKGSKFADVLSSALRRCCEGDRPSGALKENDARREFVTRCAAALGRLARRGPASSSAHVEVEVSRALAWLDEPLEKRSRYSRKRLAACLVLRELARHAPTLFYARVRPRRRPSNVFRNATPSAGPRFLREDLAGRRRRLPSGRARRRGIRVGRGLGTSRRETRLQLGLLLRHLPEGPPSTGKVRRGRPEGKETVAADADARRSGERRRNEGLLQHADARPRRGGDALVFH